MPDTETHKRTQQKRLWPAHAMPLLLMALFWNTVVYSGSRLITRHWHHYNLETVLDTALPFAPWTVLIYLGCYLFWVGSYILFATQRKEIAYQFFSADLLAKSICLLCFLLLPTTNTRPEFIVHDIWTQIMALLYQIDAADNLFPSIHCLTSWFCYIGLTECRNVPNWYRRVACCIAIAICISTLTTKQHILLDVAGGILLAQASLFLAKHTSIGQSYEKILQALLQHLSSFR